MKKIPFSPPDITEEEIEKVGEKDHQVALEYGTKIKLENEKEYKVLVCSGYTRARRYKKEIYCVKTVFPRAAFLFYRNLQNLHK